MVVALVFYYGAVLTSSLHASTEQILTVFSMLLFSMVNVKAMLSLSTVSFLVYTYFSANKY